MPVTAPSRLLLRQSRALVRRPAFRQASTTAESAAKAKDAAAKASEGLAKVTSVAGPAVAGAVQGIGGALKRVGGRTGRMVSFVESLIPPTLYYSKVAIELSKIVFRSQKMAPPSLATFQGYFQPLLASARKPSTITSYLNNPNGAVARLRSLDKKQWAIAGVTAAEVLGFFSVGEILGRFKVVGYRGETGHAEH